MRRNDGIASASSHATVCFVMDDRHGNQRLLSDGRGLLSCVSRSSLKKEMNQESRVEERVKSFWWESDDKIGN